MGLTLKSNEILSSIATSFDLPISDAVGIYLFDANSIGKNYGSGAKPKVIGTPIRTNQFGVKFNRTNYIDLNMILAALKPTAPEYTIIPVVSNVTDTAKYAPIVSSYTNRDAAGATINGEGVIYQLANATVVTNSINSDGSYSSPVVSKPRSGWADKSIIVPSVRFKFNDKLNFFELNSGQAATNSRTETVPVMPVETLRIGNFGAARGPVTDETTDSNMVFYGVFVFTRYLSDEEMTTMRTWIQSEFLASRGLSF